MREKVLKGRSTGNVVDMFQWRWNANVSELCCRREGGGTLFESSLFEPSVNALERPGAVEDDESKYLETLNLFRKAYSLRMHHEFLGYIPDELERKLMGGTMLAIARLFAWVVPVVLYFAEREVCGVHRQKIYAVTFGRKLGRAVGMIVGQICQTGEFLEPEIFQVSFESEYKGA